MLDLRHAKYPKIWEILVAGRAVLANPQEEALKAAKHGERRKRLTNPARPRPRRHVHTPNRASSRIEENQPVHDPNVHAAESLAKIEPEKNALGFQDARESVNGVILEGELPPGVLSQRVPVLAQQISLFLETVVHLVQPELDAAMLERSVFPSNSLLTLEVDGAVQEDHASRGKAYFLISAFRQFQVENTHIGRPYVHPRCPCGEPISVAWYRGLMPRIKPSFPNFRTGCGVSLGVPP